MSSQERQGTLHSTPAVPRATLVPLLVSLLLGAALLAAAISGYFLGGNQYTEKAAWGLDRSALRLLSGSGERVGRNLSIQDLDGDGQALVALPLRPFNAVGIAGVRITVSSMHSADLRVSLVWHGSGETRNPYSAILEPTAGRYSIDLYRAEGWIGEIHAPRVRVEGVVAEPFSIERVEFLPAPPRPAALFREIWREWTEFEGWRGHSINFVIGGARSPLLSPVLAAALWVGLSAVIHLVLALVGMAAFRALPFLVIFLTGWIALDARWQWDLIRQVQSTHAQFAGTNADAKRHSELDRALHDLAEIVKAKHAKPDARVLVFSDQPTANPHYHLRARLHYHLLPLNVASVWRFPDEPITVPGDLIVVLATHTRLSFAKESGVLRWGQGLGRALPVEKLVEHPLGVVYRAL